MIEPEQIELAKAIREGRASHNLSQEDLAKIVGLTRISITNMENGNQRIAWHHIIKISKISGIKKRIISILRRC